MKQIEFLKHLIDDAESEIKYIEAYQDMETLSEKSGSWDSFYRMRSPSRQRIKDDLKMARRISIGIEKEIER